VVEAQVVVFGAVVVDTTVEVLFAVVRGVVVLAMRRASGCFVLGVVPSGGVSGGTPVLGAIMSVVWVPGAVVRGGSTVLLVFCPRMSSWLSAAVGEIVSLSSFVLLLACSCTTSPSGCVATISRVPACCCMSRTSFVNTGPGVVTTASASVVFFFHIIASPPGGPPCGVF